MLKAAADTVGRASLDVIHGGRELNNVKHARCAARCCAIILVARVECVQQCRAGSMAHANIANYLLQIPIVLVRKFDGTELIRDTKCFEIEKFVFEPMVWLCGMTELVCVRFGVRIFSSFP